MRDKPEMLDKYAGSEETTCSFAAAIKVARTSGVQQVLANIVTLHKSILQFADVFTLRWIFF